VAGTHADLEAAVAASDFATALELALERWRSTRHEALADLVDAISAQLRPAVLDPRNYHRAWLELANQRSSRDLGTLLAGLRHSIPRARREHRHTETVIPTGWVERVTALAAFPHDPRITRPLVAVLRDAPWTVFGQWTEPAYLAPLRWLVALDDARIIPALEELAHAARERRMRAMWWVFDKEVTPVLDELRRAPRGELAEVERIRALTRSLASSPAPVRETTTRDLLAMIHEDPDDDGARHVYADALIEAGDPRGEFFTLQLAAERDDISPEGVRRMRSLLRTHHAEWLGDLDFVLTGIAFERGLLAEADLAQNSMAAPAVWERAANDERLATMHTLVKGRGNERHYSAFVFSPAMRSLRTVTILSKKMFDRMCAATEPWPFEHVRFDKPVTPTQIAQLAATQALPHLDRLTVPAEALGLTELLAMLEPFARERGLSELCITDTHSWYSQSDTVLATWFGAVPAMDPIALACAWWGERISARKGASGLVVLAEVGATYRLPKTLQLMPPIERLVVRSKHAPSRTTIGPEQDLVADPHFVRMLAELAPFAPELPARWRVTPSR
jgi:uncharacterized protein (TIGR02996 family)